jgi:hypothetical protein
MGLYDTIRCKFPLPVPDNVDLSEFGGKSIGELVSFQTKGLGRGMSNYEIREDGTLWKEMYDIKYVDDPEYAKRYSSVFGSDMNDCQRAVRYNQTWVPYNVHKDVIEIHELYSPYDNKYQNTAKFDYWMSYEVTFSNSVVLEIKLLKFEKRDIRESDARLKALFDSMNPSTLERIIKGFSKFWRRLTQTRWIQ